VRIFSGLQGIDESEIKDTLDRIFALNFFHFPVSRLKGTG